MMMSTICGCGRAMNPLIFDFELFRGGLSAKAAASCRKPVKREPNMYLPEPDDGMTAEEVANALLAAFVPCDRLAAQLQQEGFAIGEWPEETRLLLVACIQALWDWFPEGDRTCRGISGLLSMDEFRAYRDYESPLDLVFRQIETGYHWAQDGQGDEDRSGSLSGHVTNERESDEGWKYVPSNMCRCDGVKPAEHIRSDGRCGMSPNEDAALGFYVRFKELAVKSPLRARAEVIRVHDAFARSLKEKEIVPERAVKEYLQAKESLMNYRAQQPSKTSEINAFERLYVASLKSAIEAVNTSDSARAMYRQMLEAELIELASANGREA